MEVKMERSYHLNDEDQTEVEKVDVAQGMSKPVGVRTHIMKIFNLKLSLSIVQLSDYLNK